MSAESPRKGEEKAPTFDTWLAGEVRSLIGKKPPASAKKSGDAIDALVAHIATKVPADLQGEVNRPKVVTAIKDSIKYGSKLLTNAVSARVDGKKVAELLKRHAPKGAVVASEAYIEALVKEMHGRVKAPYENLQTAVSGINRVNFMNAKDVTLAKTSYGAPFHALSDVDSDKLKIAVISGLQFGLPYDTDIFQNLSRCGFSAARKLDCDAIVIGGGLFHMDMRKRSGPARLNDDMLTGSDIDIEAFAKDYQDEVKEIKESGSLDPIFQTEEEYFLNVLLRGLVKVTRRPRREGSGTVDEFHKKVYVILNPDDLKIPKAWASFHLLYKQTQRFAEAQALARRKAKEVVMYEKLIESGNASRVTYNELDRARKESAAAAAKVNRFRMTRTHRTQNKLVFKRALSYFIQKIEETIPNSKVIASGGAYVRFGKSKNVIEFISSDRSVHIKELKSHGPKQRKSQLPDLTVSMHPGAEYPRKGSREDYRIKGKMLGTVGFFEAPILVDKEAILSSLEGVQSNLPAVKAVRDDMFVGGMSVIELDPHFMPNANVLPTEVVRHHGQPQVSRAPAKRVWLWLATDPHLGAANRLWLHTKQDVPIGVCEAGFELMSQSGMNRNGLAHVSGIIFCDDLTQGNHFGTHQRPHHNQRTNAEIFMDVDAKLRKFREMANGKLRERGKDQLIVELTKEFAARPPHHWGSQLKEFWRAVLDAYEPVFKGALLRAREQGLIVKGISQFTGAQIDARDIGLINFGSGNHATKTLDSAAFEGEIVADRLQVALRKDPDLKGLDLMAWIRGPMHQDQSIGFGMLKLGKDGSEWGIHIAGTPPKRDSWYDLLHGWVQVNRQRGDTSTILGNVPILHMTGDKHFFGYATAGGDQYIMGPSSTHTDAFADIAGGLPPNNPGLAFVGLPVEGPDKAEVVVKHLTPKEMQEFLSSGKPFPWEDFLPNRA